MRFVFIWMVVMVVATKSMARLTMDDAEDDDDDAGCAAHARL